MNDVKICPCGIAKQDCDYHKEAPAKPKPLLMLDELVPVKAQPKTPEPARPLAIGDRVRVKDTCECVECRGLEGRIWKLLTCNVLPTAFVDISKDYQAHLYLDDLERVNAPKPFRCGDIVRVTSQLKDEVGKVVGHQRQYFRGDPQPFDTYDVATETVDYKALVEEDLTLVKPAV